MKTLILTLAILMATPFVSISKASPIQVQQSVTLSKPIFGIGKPKYNKRKFEKRNMPGPINRRAKKLQRKNGIGLITLNSTYYVA